MSKSQQLAELFRDKIVQKFGSINERVLKKLFHQVDLDNDGSIDEKELYSIMTQYLIGVKERDVYQLIDQYDRDGEGMLSFPAFLTMMTAHEKNQNEDETGPLSRSSAKKQPSKSSKEPKSNEFDRYEHQIDSSDLDQLIDDAHSVDSVPLSYVSSEFNQDNEIEADRRTKQFLSQVKSTLLSKALTMIQNSTGPTRYRQMTMSHREALETVARKILIKAFQEFTGKGDGRSKETSSLVPKQDFIRILRSFKIPGSTGVRVEVLEHVFSLCAIIDEEDEEELRYLSFSQKNKSLSGRRGSSSGGGAGSGAWRGRPRDPEADPEIFAELIFGAKDPILSNQKGDFNAKGRTLKDSSATGGTTSGASSGKKTLKDLNRSQGGGGGGGGGGYSHVDPLLATRRYAYIQATPGCGTTLAVHSVIPDRREKDSYLESIDEWAHVPGIEKITASHVEKPQVLSTGDIIKSSGKKKSGAEILKNSQDPFEYHRQQQKIVPGKYAPHKFKQTFSAPSNFDQSWVNRSSRVPEATLQKMHVFGLSPNLFSGPSIHRIPTPLDASLASGGGGGSGGGIGGGGGGVGGGGRRGAWGEEDITLVYPGAGMGIVHTLGQTNRQFFFERHDNDVTCLCVSTDGQLAASGQMGKSPFVLIWRTNLIPKPKTERDREREREGGRESRSKMSQDGLVAEIGRGRFETGINAVCFSPDKLMIGVVNCDMRHRMMIFEISSGLLIAEADTQHTLPPSITSLQWAPGRNHSVRAISKNEDLNGGGGEFLATSGKGSLLKLWGFKRPPVGSTKAILEGKTLSCTRFSNANKYPSTKDFTCCVFVPLPAVTSSGSSSALPDGSLPSPPFDLAAGNSNGCIYLFRGVECVGINQIMKGGGVSCLISVGDRLFISGSKGLVRVCDARTLTLIQTFDSLTGLVPSIGNPQDNRPSSSLRPGSRGASAGGGASSWAWGEGLDGERSVGSSSSRRPTSAGRPGSSSSQMRTALTGGNRPSSASKVRSNSSNAIGSGNNSIENVKDLHLDPNLTVTGLVAVYPSSNARNTSSATYSSNNSNIPPSSATLSAVGQSVTSVLVALSSGVVRKINIAAVNHPNARPSSSDGPPSSSMRRGSSAARLGPDSGKPSSALSSTPTPAPVSSVFYFHVDVVSGAARSHHISRSLSHSSSYSMQQRPSSASSSSYSQSIGNDSNLPSDEQLLVATSGQDRLLCVWDVQRRKLLTRTTLPGGSDTLDFDKSNSFLAVGTQVGGILIYALIPNSSFSSTTPTDGREIFPINLVQLSYRKDAKERIGDVKFSPDSRQLAVGSNDDHIYIYNVDLKSPFLATSSLSSSSSSSSLHQSETNNNFKRRSSVGGGGGGVGGRTEGGGGGSGREWDCTLSLLYRLGGHTSFLLHLDWSVDGRLLQSVCGAQEIIFWDLSKGTKVNSAIAKVMHDVKWATHTCTHGFSVMGIWPKFAKGLDLNAIDVNKDKGYLVSANNDSFVHLMNYPCLVRNAPRKKYTGHSSHVSNVKFFPGGSGLVSVGGKDAAVILWRLLDRSDRLYEYAAMFERVENEVDSLYNHDSVQKSKQMREKLSQDQFEPEL